MEKLKDIHSLKFPHIYVLSASAGSGKTYALSLRYLQLLLSSQHKINMKEILAITYTNKASLEMKTRIINWLKKISLDKFDYPYERKDILQVTKENFSFIRKRSYVLLEEILKNYNFFQVRTIDSFIHSLLSCCGYELNLSPYFKTTKDYFSYLEYALNELLRKSQRDKRVFKLFKDFINYYLMIEDTKEWFPKRSILYYLIGLWEHKNRRGKNFLLYERKEREIFFRIKKLIEDLKNNLPFQNVNKRFWSALERAQNKDGFSIIKELKNHLVKEKIPLHKGTVVLRDLDSLWKKLKEEVKNFCESLSFGRFRFYIEVLEEMISDVEEMKKKKNILFLEELNRKMKEIFSFFSLPQIYYRLATKFSHYLIDEFQDTSRLQWNNLYPLIEEALSSGGSLFYVGDKKQAIYRFRGGDLSLFEEIKETFPSVEVVEGTLSENFRSKKTIVDFNNDIFSSQNIGDFLRKNFFSQIGEEGIEYIKDVFKESKQTGMTKEEGYIRAEVVKIEDDEEIMKEKLISLLNELKERFSLSDIAILLRDNKSIGKISSWLIEKESSVESETTLNIRENPLIKEIINLLKFFYSPIDNLSFASFIKGNIFLKVSKLKEEEIHNFLYQFRKSSFIYIYRQFQKEYPHLWENYFEEFFKSVGFLPLYEFLISIFKKFKIYENFSSYYGFFVSLLELVKEKEDELESMGSFLEFFSKGKDEDFYINLPSKKEAVKILTIHKSKGLEFRVVILPYLNLEPQIGEKRNVPRVVLEEKDNLYLIYLKKDFINYSDKLKLLYQVALRDSLIDELNTIYVALTRAIEELYIFSVTKSNTSRKNYILDLIWKEEELIKKGKRKKNIIKKRVSVQDFPPPIYQDWIEKMKEEFLTEIPLDKKELTLGEALHYALSWIGNLKEEKDIFSLIKKITSGVSLIYGVCEETLKRILGEVTEDEKLRKFFYLTSKEKFFNEKEIVNLKGELKRVDRLIEKEDGIYVLDYKLSKKNIEDDCIQIREYLQVLNSLYPDKKIEGFLYYIREKELIKVKDE